MYFLKREVVFFGDLTIEYTIPGYEGKTQNLSSHPDGYAIGPSMTSAELVDTSAELCNCYRKRWFVH